MKHFNKVILGMTTLAGAAAMFTASTSIAHADDAVNNSSVQQANQEYLFGSSSSDASSSSTSTSTISSSSSSSSTSTSSSSSSSSNGTDTSSSDSDKPDVSDYDIQKNDQYRLRTVNTGSETFWSQPYSTESTKVGDTSALLGQLVKITQVATDGNNTYFDVQGLGPTNGGKDLGWINATALSTTSDYELPFTYSSQLYPTYAPDACEVVSLKMILSVRGLAEDVSTKEFIDGVPRSTNPNYGYTADPYRHGSHATIYPAALAKYAQKWTDNVHDITGASLNKLIYEIRHGNPVVFEGSWRMQQTKSDHILALVGYKPGYFQIADPYMRQNSKNKVFWTSTSNFMNLFTTSFRGSRAIVFK